MNTSLTSAKGASSSRLSFLVESVGKSISLLERIPPSLVALLARFSIAAVFWAPPLARRDR